MKKKVALKLLFELIKNSKRSDIELAKLLRVSQPTITRMRQKLEKKTIREYTAIPDWVELGYEIIAFTFFNMGIPPNERQEETRKAIDWVMNYPNVIFASKGDGMGKNGVCISFHKNYTSFADFVSKCQAEWGKYLVDMQFFIISLRGGLILKPFSLKYLEKAEEF